MGDFMGLFKLFRPDISEEQLDYEIKRSHSFLFSRLTERWERSYFDSDAFFLRLHRALYDLPEYSFTISKDNSMQIYSENQCRAYYCDLTHCECEDFRKKQMPCKHMIFLDMKLNGLGSFYFDTFGFSRVDLDNVTSAGQGVWDVMRHFSSAASGSPVCSLRTPALDHLFHGGYLVEAFFDTELLKKFSRPELAALVRISGNKPSGSKDKIISWVLSNSPAIIQYCRLRYAFWYLSGDHAGLFHFLHRYSDVNNCLPRGW